MHEGPVEYEVDLRHGQKTGLFLDQRENHAAAAGYARGRLLDAFSYHGGFALAMAAACSRVEALDVSAPAVAQIRANAARNRLPHVEAREANAFDELRRLDKSGARFDTVVLDPPAFAKNKAALDKALAGYKEINLRALRLLEPGGVLVTCTCSYHVDDALVRRGRARGRRRRRLPGHGGRAAHPGPRSPGAAGRAGDPVHDLPDPAEDGLRRRAGSMRSARWPRCRPNRLCRGWRRVPICE